MPSKKRCSRILLFFIAIMFLFPAMPPAGAQQYYIESEALSIILVIDVSGSMRWTDPDMLRETAAHVFIDLLSTDDNLGIIIFDHEAEVVVPLQSVQSAGNKERIKNILSPRLQPRGDTDFLTALETAHVQLSEGNMEGTRPVVVLLTDGDPDPDPARRTDAAFMANYMDNLWKMVNRFTLDNYPIYTVGFSDEIDPKLIERISIDSKGDYYILNEPADLLLSFFELLGNLKNRRGFFKETVMLTQEEQSFPFIVNELTRQVNLVAAGTTGGNVQLSLIPPHGTFEEVAGGTVENKQNYSIAVLHQPAEAFWGEWQLKVSGSGEINVLGDMDLHIKAWLEEPTPLSKHPLNEPIQFKVAVTQTEQLGQLPFQVDLQITRPGESTPALISLVPEQEYFIGSYDGVNRTGTYEILVRVLMDGEVISTLPSRIYVRRIPSLTADFWGGGAFRQGEELLITASLTAANRRISEGSDLELDAFQFVLTNERGEKTVMPFYDSGDPEHGDTRAGDGIYSNLQLFDQAGSFNPAVLAMGKYLGEDFILEKTLEPFAVHPPGSISVDKRPRDFWSVPGGRIAIPLELKNQSAFRETLYFEVQEGIGVLSPNVINLEPGDSKKVNLELSLFNNLEIKNHLVLLSFQADHAMTKTQPSEYSLAINISTPLQAFLERFRPAIMAVSAILAVILAASFLLYAGGLLLYRILVYPNTFVRGNLVYEKLNGGTAAVEMNQTLNLSGKKKDTLVITFNPENKEADYYVEGSEYIYDLIMIAHWNIRLPRFFQGWKALKDKHVPIRTLVKCTPPGIIEYNGSIYTEKELLHEDEFETGDFLFKYVNPYGKWYKEKNNNGVDILKDKFESSEP